MRREARALYRRTRHGLCTSSRHRTTIKSSIWRCLRLSLWHCPTRDDVCYDKPLKQTRTNTDSCILMQANATHARSVAQPHLRTDNIALSQLPVPCVDLADCSVTHFCCRKHAATHHGSHPKHNRKTRYTRFDEADAKNKLPTANVVVMNIALDECDSERSSVIHSLASIFRLPLLPKKMTP